MTVEKIAALGGGPNLGSSPMGHAVLGGVSLFFTSRGLYRTDGTPQGTELVSDLLPGPASPEQGAKIAVRRGVAYWTSGQTLWRSDGSSAGTVALQALPLPASEVFLYDDALYFSVGDALYRSSGGAAEVLASGVRVHGGAMVAGGVAYFPCSVADSGVELCSTDGTAAGTGLAASLREGPGGSSPRLLGVVGTRLLFTAAATAGRGLWGLELPTGTPQELLAPAADRDAVPARVQAAALLSDRAYLPCFTAATGEELCSTDGTAAGTTVVELVPGAAGSSPEVTPLGAALIAVASSPATGRELWRSDGTAAGTALLRELAPGAADGVAPTRLVVTGDALYFAAVGSGGAAELWKTDGTAGGTARVQSVQLQDPAYELALEGAVALGPRLLFAGDDGVTSFEPWSSDGTPAGTALLHDVAGPRAQLTGHASFSNFTLLATANALWRTDGTSAGTRLLVPGTFTLLAQLQGYFYYSDPTGLWRLDLAGRPEKVVELAGGFGAAAVVNRRLVLVGAGPGATSSLWLSDGSSAGTLATSIIEVTSLHVVDSLVYFSGRLAVGADLGAELWVTDGTVAGTRLVMDINPTGASRPHSISASPFVALPGSGLANAFFAAADGTSGDELWKTDGTAAGTVQVADLLPGASSSSPRDLFSGLGGVLFTASTGPGGVGELWKSDGTATRTARVKAVEPVGAGDGSIFAARSAAGVELWRSDGTDQGTALIEDLAPGPHSSRPEFLSPQYYGAPLLFVAERPDVGRELWSMTASSPPELLADLAPGARSSHPRVVRVTMPEILVAADDEADLALWRVVVPLSPPPWYYEDECSNCDCCRAAHAGPGNLLLVFAVVLLARRRRPR